LLDGDPASSKRAQALIFGPCLLWPNGRPSQLLLSTCCRAHECDTSTDTTTPTARPRYRPTRSVTIVRIYVRSTAMRPNNVKLTLLFLLWQNVLAELCHFETQAPTFQFFSGCKSLSSHFPLLLPSLSTPLSCREPASQIHLGSFGSAISSAVCSGAGLLPETHFCVFLPKSQ